MAKWEVWGCYDGMKSTHFQSFETEHEAFEFLEEKTLGFEFLEIRYKDEIILRYWIQRKEPSRIPKFYREVDITKKYAYLT